MEIGPETATAADRLYSAMAAPLDSATSSIGSSPGENSSSSNNNNNKKNNDDSGVGRYDLLDDDDEEDVCRICRNPGEADNPLRYPCACSGSIKFVHQDCLLQWLNHSNARQCEVRILRLM